MFDETASYQHLQVFAKIYFQTNLPDKNINF